MCLASLLIHKSSVKLIYLAYNLRNIHCEIKPTDAITALPTEETIQNYSENHYSKLLKIIVTIHQC